MASNSGQHKAGQHKASQKKGNSYKPGLNKKGYNKNNGKEVQIYSIIPLLLIIAIVPLIMYVKTIVLSDAGNLYWDGNDTHYDIFSYYKMVNLLVFTVFGLLMYLFTKRDNPFSENESKIYYIPMGIFIIVAFLSALFSEYKAVSFGGFLDRYEGLFVLIAYIIILFLAMNGFREETAIKALFICLLSSAFILTLLGALQFFGIDYFKLDLVQKLITPETLQANGGINATFGVKTIFTTLYNPNYVGSYTAMLLPIVIVFLIFVKKNSHRIALAILLCTTALCWVGCDSRAGMFGGIFSLVIITVMFRKKIVAHKKIAAIAVVLAVAAVIVFNFTTGGSITNKISNMMTLGTKVESTEEKTKIEKGIAGIKDISMDSEGVFIKTDKGTLQVILKENKIKIIDENENEIKYSVTNNTIGRNDDTSISSSTITIDDSRFGDMRLEVYSQKGMVEIYNKDYKLFDFILTKEGLRSTSNRWMIYRNDKDLESFGFTGNETMGSGRGYIWSRSLPLLKKTILWGNGPDTYAIFFPQYDYLGKLITYENGGIFVDKAHNYYMQTAINTGIVSLLALLTIFVMYFVTSIKIYIREKYDGLLSYSGLACFAAFCGYIVTAIFNDSVVSVAPVFWTLLGAGVGINTVIRSKRTVGKV